MRRIKQKVNTKLFKIMFKITKLKNKTKEETKVKVETGSKMNFDFDNCGGFGL